MQSHTLWPPCKGEIVSQSANHYDQTRWCFAGTIPSAFSDLEQSPPEPAGSVLGSPKDWNISNASAKPSCCLASRATVAFGKHTWRGHKTPSVSDSSASKLSSAKRQGAVSTTGGFSKHGRSKEVNHLLVKWRLGWFWAIRWSVKTPDVVEFPIWFPCQETKSEVLCIYIYIESMTQNDSSTTNVSQIHKISYLSKKWKRGEHAA